MVRREKLLNPLILSVFISILVIYSRAGKVRLRDSFSSVIPENEIKNISGLISSSPARTSKGTYYSCDLQVFETWNEKMISSGKGKVRIYIPSDYVEAFFPGKLYSLSKAEGLIETGSFVQLKGRFSDSAFFTEKVISCRFADGKNNRFRIIRAKGRLKFKRMMYSWGHAGGLLLALLSGAREYTEPPVSENFRRAGLSHILALSGMHLSMFSGLAVFLGSRLGRKRIALILQLMAVTAFVWFAGFSPSLLRAFICLSVVLFQGILSIEKSDMLTVLCFSFFVQCLISPSDLFNTGFILSYGALAGILMTGEFFRKLYGMIIPGRISASLAGSTGAQLITLPVSAKLFGMITPVGIISAVFVSPLVTVFIFSGLAFIVLGLLFPPLCSLGEFFMRIQYNLIKYLVGFFAQVPPLIF